MVNGNTLNGGGIGALSGVRTQSAAIVVSIGTCNTCGFNGFIGRIRNNILDGGKNFDRFGVREDPAATRTMRPELLENNMFWFAPASTPGNDVLYRQIDAQGMPTDHKSVATIHALVMPASAGNVQSDPMLDSLWHLVAGSPCIDTGTAMEAPPADFEGQARPSGAGIDIGHDEM